MPLTFPAHQAVVLPIKLRWPDRTDGTAMCVGAAAPDLLYPVAGIGTSGHSFAGVLIGAVPLTLSICWLLRWRSALGVFANLPDADPFRLHSYRVITQRHPAVATTSLSALTGARVLQYLGHGLGSLIAIGLLFHIGRSRRLEQWYGAAAVASARTFPMAVASRVQFWAVFVAVAVLVTTVLSTTGGSLTFSILDGVVFGALAAGALPGTVSARDRQCS